MMSVPLRQTPEGSPSESVHFAPTSTFMNQAENCDRIFSRMAMAPPLSSASRAPSRPPCRHEDERGSVRCMHGGFERPECDCSIHRHTYNDHLGLHSGTLIEHLLLQENQKALRMASLVHSQTSGCLASGCHTCGSSEKRLRFKEHEERMLEEQRWSCRSVVGGPATSGNVHGTMVEDDDSPDRWFRQPRVQQPHAGIEERGQATRVPSSGGEPRSQGTLLSCPVAGQMTKSTSNNCTGVSFSQEGRHMQDRAGAEESYVLVHGGSDGGGRGAGRESWPHQRKSYSGTVRDEEGRPTKSKSGSGAVLATARDKEQVTLPGMMSRSIHTNSGRNLQGASGDACISLPQSTRSSSQGRPGLPENSVEFSYQENLVQQADTLRLITDGPVFLSNWYLIRVQDSEVSRTAVNAVNRVAVGGWLMDKQEQVRSAPISERIDFRKVITDNGVEVSLQGSMNQEASIANGFSAGIVQCLSTGFPYLWKQYMRVKTVGEYSMGGSASLGVNISNRPAEKEITSSRGCEVDSNAGRAADVIHEPSTVQNHLQSGSESLEAVTPVTEAAHGQESQIQNIEPCYPQNFSERLKTVSLPAAAVQENAPQKLNAETKPKESSFPVTPVTEAAHGQESQIQNIEPCYPQNFFERLKTVSLPAAAVQENAPQKLNNETKPKESSSPGTSKSDTAVGQRDPEFLVVEGDNRVMTVNLVGASATSQKARKNRKISLEPVRRSQRLKLFQLGFTEQNADPEDVIGRDNVQREKGSESTSPLNSGEEKDNREVSVMVPGVCKSEQAVKTNATRQTLPLNEQDAEQGGGECVTEPAIGVTPMDEITHRKNARSNGMKRVPHEMEVLTSRLKRVKEVAEEPMVSESAPITPPQLIIKRSQRNKKNLDENQSLCLKNVSFEITPPVTRSLKRLQRLSGDASSLSMGAVPTPSTCDEERLEPSKRFKSGSKGWTSIDRSGQLGTLHEKTHDTLEGKGVHVAWTIQQSGETIQKSEQKKNLRSAQVSPHHSGEFLDTLKQSDEVKPSVSATKIFRGSSSKREGKVANHVEKREKFRKAKKEEDAHSSRNCMRGRSIIPPPLPKPRVQDKSLVPEAFGLKMSRSGRILVPPLAYWRSQSIGYDLDGGIIAIFDGFKDTTADTGCFTFTPPQEKHARKIQKELCKAAVRVTKPKQRGRS